MSVEPRRPAGVVTWAGIILGVTADVLLVGIVKNWFLPEAGMLHAVLIAVLSAVAIAFSVTAVVRDKRGVLNWVALAVSAPPLLFLTLFGLGELLGPSH